MGSRFKELKEQLRYTFNEDERTILLKAMAKVGNFEELKEQLIYTVDQDEREILVEGMIKNPDDWLSRFEELKEQLRYTVDLSERRIWLEAMALAGSFEELKEQLSYMADQDERKILLKAMVEKPQVLTEESIKVVKEKGRVKAPGLQKRSKPAVKNYDVFIAHASEDKKSFVTPLALSLKQRGLEVWYDDFILEVGDSLRREIDKGLASSQYGIVVLSHNFLKKHWPQKELDGLAAREELDNKVILPVWHNINKKEVASYSPTLADLVAVKSSEGVKVVTNKIIKVIAR